jgi:hypothetical protein
MSSDEDALDIKPSSAGSSIRSVQFKRSLPLKEKKKRSEKDERGM